MTLVPVGGIALEHHAVARRPRLHDEGTGADRVAIVVVALGLDRRRRLHRAVLVRPHQQRGHVHHRIAQIEDDGQLVLGLDAVDVRDIEGAAAVVLRILLAIEVPHHRLGIERRAVLEFHIRPQLVGPRLVVLGTGPRHGKLGLGLAVVVEAGQRVEDQAGGDIARGVIDADLQRIEAQDVELEADRERAALLLGHRRRSAEAQGRGRQDEGRRKQTVTKCRRHQ